MTMTTTDLGTASQECKTIKDSEKVCNTRADPMSRPMWTMRTQKGNILGTTVVSDNSAATTASHKIGTWRHTRADPRKVAQDT